MSAIVRIARSVALGRSGLEVLTLFVDGFRRHTVALAGRYPVDSYANWYAHGEAHPDGHKVKGRLVNGVWSHGELEPLNEAQSAELAMSRVREEVGA